MEGTPNPTPQEKAILATVTYFDLFSYPLTPLEIWKWLYIDNNQLPSSNNQQITLDEVFSLLQTSEYLMMRLQSNEGFFFLRGNQGNVVKRKERYILAERKYALVLKAVRTFRYLPFIRLIAVCNSLAYSNTRDDGDLDFFIVTAPGRVWTTRFLTATLAQALGWRPKTAHARDGVCLSFFLDEDHLDLKPILLQPEDLYMRYWIDQLVPVYGDIAVLEAFRQSNGWYRSHLPQSYGTAPTRRRWVDSTSISRASNTLLRTIHTGRIGDMLERRYANVQRRILPTPLRELANRDSRVVMNEYMLKFHENDRREEFNKRFAQLLTHNA